MINDANRKLKEEQDQKYQEMIQTAKIDEEKKNIEEANQAIVKMQEEEAKKEIENKKEQIKESLGPEPEANSEEPIMKCVFRIPNGNRVNRRFLRSSKLQNLHDYVYIMDDIGLEEDDIGYYLMSGYPRVKITDMEQTLQERYGDDKKQDMFMVCAITKDNE